MLELGALDEVAAAAEKAGFDAISLTEHPIPGAAWLESGGHQSLDPFVALGFAAAATTRLRLMTNLVVAPYRNPFLLAKAAATRRQGRGRRGGPARPGPLDFTSSYSGAQAAVAPGADADRHREEWAELEKIGVTWLIISPQSNSAAETFGFIEAFGGTYLS